MWRCAKCGEQIEDNFEICWNCGTGKDGSQPSDPQELLRIRKEHKLWRARRENESKHETENTAPQSPINIEQNQAQRSRPAKVSMAVKLLYVTLGIGVLRFIIDPSSLSQIAQLSQIEQMDLEVFVGIIVLLSFILIWFFIYMIGKGRNWARITFLVSFIIGTPFTVSILLQSLVAKPISGLLDIGPSVLQGIALVFLFQKPSSEWFRKMRAK